eukprot:5987279-Alexandrium_andersonii.AAC.1
MPVTRRHCCRRPPSPHPGRGCAACTTGAAGRSRRCSGSTRSTRAAPSRKGSRPSPSPAAATTRGRR